MKWTRIIAGAVALTVTVFLFAGDQPVRTFRGEISDSQCALNVHSLTRSHQEMLKSKSMGGTAAECSRYCIEHLGGRLVLAAGANVYYIDGADSGMQYLGQKVRIRGILDAKAKTIHVVTIDPEK
jgi:hypothetical protein